VLLLHGDLLTRWGESRLIAVRIACRRSTASPSAAR
jgi:hypothetical protein